jgi:hypothetical protein
VTIMAVMPSAIVALINSKVVCEVACIRFG